MSTIDLFGLTLAFYGTMPPPRPPRPERNGATWAAAVIFGGICLATIGPMITIWRPPPLRGGQGALHRIRRPGPVRGPGRQRSLSLRAARRRPTPGRSGQAGGLIRAAARVFGYIRRLLTRTGCRDLGKRALSMGPVDRPDAVGCRGADRPRAAGRHHHARAAAQARVGAAIGWIGLAWLTPFFGSLLYLFGINRVSAAPGSCASPRLEETPEPASRGTRGVRGPRSRGLRLTRRPAVAGTGGSCSATGTRPIRACGRDPGGAGPHRPVELHLPRRRDRRPDSSTRWSRRMPAGWRSVSSSTASAAAISSRPPIAVCGGRRSGGAVHAFPAALADAVPEPAVAQEDADRGWRGPPLPAA